MVTTWASAAMLRAVRVSASDGGTLKLWDVERRAGVRSLRGHLSRVASVAVSPDGRRAVSGGWHDVVKSWDLNSGAEICSFPVRNRSRRR
jgi:WD40 repeat protein